MAHRTVAEVTTICKVALIRLALLEWKAVESLTDGELMLDLLLREAGIRNDPEANVGQSVSTAQS